ncbi:ATP-binding protein [Olleya sp. YS]|uniref:hybrid sensor histidine kinase/response regulator n=1 Tax=Olleya sp. YS TaxID=3028318 RepID=UPI0024340C1E|nr:ATP-binding protein [Olleya sp. YS]WGD33826.1 ATP-binding protein [Olleya sp. YS]
MKEHFSTTFSRMLALISITGILFLTLCLVSIFFLDNHYNTAIIILMASFIVILTIYAITYKTLINKPLSLITKILENNDEVAISELQKFSTEFSHIGDLFISNNKQKEELKNAKEKAEESELLKSSFLTNLSHEIRTPMNAILGFSDILSTQQLSETEKNEYIEVITRSGKNLVSIIDDLIEMSKIDTNQVKPNFGAFNLDEVLHDIKKTVEITIPKDKPLQIFLDQPNHPVVYQFITDETKFRQIIVNLVNNAVKYSEKGVVNFGYKINPDDNALEFYIKDTGIGMSKEDSKNIFNRFNRIQNDHTINLSGLGLGLAISKAYIEMLGGKIWLESEENVGTTFTFTIPLKLNGLPITPKKEIELNPVDKVKPLTILIAEDNNINFMLIKRVMDIRKYTVLRANNGIEAVKICRENDSIQLVIMDLKMPLMGGFEAKKIIKSFRPYLPIIAHTAYSSAEINSEVYDAGFIDCISKPLDKTKLFRVIDRIEHLTPDPIMSKLIYS